MFVFPHSLFIIHHSNFLGTMSAPFVLCFIMGMTVLQHVRTDTDADNTCTLTGKEPSQPQAAIRFCSMFSNNACCDPAIDTEIQGYYNDMIG